MSELTNPTPADWELWEPLIRDRYKKEPLRVIRQEMEDNGLKVTVKMLRDRYKKWNINDKNCKNRPRRRAAAAPRGLTTQMALRQSPRIVELEDDESHFAQDLAGPQNESGVLDQQMLLADLRTGSLHAALASLDPTFHEIMNGLSDWCDAWVNFPFTPDGTNSGAALKAVILESIPMRELSRAESLQAWRRLVDACSIEVMLVGLRDTSLLVGLMILISFSQPTLHTSPIRGMLRFLHQCSVQILGPRHPVTLLTNCSAPPRLPPKPLQDIVKGLFQIRSHRFSIIHHRRIKRMLFKVQTLCLSVGSISRNPALMPHKPSLRKGKAGSEEANGIQADESNSCATISDYMLYRRCSQAK